jgi:hypothetical protein
MRTPLIALLCVALGSGWLVAEGQDQPKPPAKPKAKAAKPKAKTPAKPKDEGPTLPELADAAVTNAYAFYSQPGFDFVLDRHLRATIFLKDKGERVGKPVKISAPQFATPNAKTPPKTPPAKLVEFTDAPAPKAQAAEFEVGGKLNNEATFAVKYKFTASTVNMACSLHNAPGGEGATPLFLEFTFPTTHTFTPNIEMADRKKAVEGWYIKTREKGDKDKNFKSYAYTYWDLAKFKKEAQNVEVYGPWGTRKFLIRTSGPGESDLSLEAGRGHRYPYTGFDCLFKLPTGGKKKNEAATLTFSIE